MNPDFDERREHQERQERAAHVAHVSHIAHILKESVREITSWLIEDKDTGVRNHLEALRMLRAEVSRQIQVECAGRNGSGSGGMCLHPECPVQERKIGREL